jgi:hypothetical protein
MRPSDKIPRVTIKASQENITAAIHAGREVMKASVSTTGPCRGPCFIASSKPWHSITGQPRRKQYTYLLSCRGRPPMFCTVSLLEQSSKIPSRCSRAITGTTKWLQHTAPNCKPGSLQEFAATIEQLAHWALVELPEYYKQKEAAYAFTEGVKQHFLMGNERRLNEALSQDLKLEAAEAAAGLPTRLQEVKYKALRE